MSPLSPYKGVPPPPRDSPTKKGWSHTYLKDCFWFAGKTIGIVTKKCPYPWKQWKYSEIRGLEQCRSTAKKEAVPYTLTQVNGPPHWDIIHCTFLNFFPFYLNFLENPALVGDPHILLSESIIFFQLAIASVSMLSHRRDLHVWNGKGFEKSALTVI